MKDKLKNVGVFMFGVAMLLVAMLLILMLIEGGVWLSDKLYPWLVGLCALATVVSIVVLLPLAAFRRTRGVSAVGLLVVSYIFGLTMWIWGLLTTYILWGGFAVLLGLAVAGIGVIPMAILAAICKGMWGLAGQFVLCGVITWGTRMLSFGLLPKAEHDDDLALEQA